MIRNTVGYVAGILLFGSILAFAVWMLLSILSFTAVVAVVFLPFWGAYRRRKNWMYESLGLRRWLGGFRKVFKFGKPRLTFYLILSVVIGFTYEQIALTTVYMVGGLISTLIVWESVRFVALKTRKVEMLSFASAMKSTW